MFGIADLFSLILSAFIILPVVIFLRESGYLIVSWFFGVVNPRLTIGSGPRIKKIGMFDIRKYYHVYSWFSYDDLKYKNRFAYVSIYAGPILANLTSAITINLLIANGWIVEYKTFWDRFIFYSFYYILFDAIPVITVNGKPNNGMIIYEMLRCGKRVDYNNEPFLPTTASMDEEYQELKESLKQQDHKTKKHP